LDSASFFPWVPSYHRMGTFANCKGYNPRLGRHISSWSSIAPGRHCRSSRLHSYGRAKCTTVSRNYRSLAGLLPTENTCNRMENKGIEFQTVAVTLVLPVARTGMVGHWSPTQSSYSA